MPFRVFSQQTTYGSHAVAKKILFQSVLTEKAKEALLVCLPGERKELKTLERKRWCWGDNKWTAVQNANIPELSDRGEIRRALKTLARNDCGAAAFPN